MVKETPSRKAPPPSRQEHACPDCKQVFSRAEYARRHWKAKHAPGGTSSRCSQCDIPFARPDILARHIRLYHDGDDEARLLEGDTAACVPAPVPIAPAPAAKPRSRRRPVSVSADDDPLIESRDAAESPEARWRLPIPPAAVDALPETGSMSGSDSTFEELQATLLSFDNVTPATPNRSEAQIVTGETANAEIFLPWDFPQFDATAPPPPPIASVAPTKRPRTRSPSPSSGSSGTSGSRVSPLDHLTLAQFVASSDSPALVTATEALSSAPSIPTPPILSQTGSDCSYDEQLFSLPPALPRIRADEIIGSRALRPRHLAIQVLDDPDADWTHEDYEDGTVSNWLQGAIVRSKEPSMYPGIDHLFGVERNTSSRFWMANQRFCIAYLFPWELPPLSRLSKFAFQASKNILPVLPLAHSPTLVLNTVEPTFAFALSVAGAGLFETYSSFSDEMSRVKREFAAEHLGEAKLRHEELLAAVQTLLLYQLLGAFSRSTEEQEYTRKHHSLLIQKFLELSVPKADIPADLDLPERDLQRLWRAWVDRETYIRIAFLCYLLDIQNSKTGSQERLLPHNHPAIAQLPVPSLDIMWAAETPVAWREAVHQQRRHNASFSPDTSRETSMLMPATGELDQPIFSTLLNSLLSRGPPANGTPAARALAVLSPNSPLAVSVVLQTLLSIDAQLSASQNLLRSIVSGTAGPGYNVPAPALIEAAKASTLDSQERVRFGLKVVRVLGGAVAQERWFNGFEAIFR